MTVGRVIRGDDLVVDEEGMAAGIFPEVLNPIPASVEERLRE